MMRVMLLLWTVTVLVANAALWAIKDSQLNGVVALMMIFPTIQMVRQRSDLTID